MALKMSDYTKKDSRGDFWCLLLSTFERGGGYIPYSKHGWMLDPSGARYENVASSPGFDEKLNFAVSEIGELASKINSKDKSYWIYGYSSFIFISRPCLDCSTAKVRCKCNILIKALQAEREQILSKMSSEFEFF